MVVVEVPALVVVVFVPAAGSDSLVSLQVDQVDLEVLPQEVLHLQLGL